MKKKVKYNIRKFLSLLLVSGMLFSMITSYVFAENSIPEMSEQMLEPDKAEDLNDDPLSPLEDNTDANNDAELQEPLNIMTYELEDSTASENTLSLFTVGQIFVIDNIRYKVLSEEGATGTVEVLGFENLSAAVSNLVIKDSVTMNGIEYQVVSIGNQAFYYFRGTRLIESVTIGNNVRHIGERAFGWNKITDVTIPEGITAIGSYAFLNNYLTTITIPDSVTIIGEGAFESNRLVSVIIPDNVVTIEGYAFSSNYTLTDVTFGNSVEYIGSAAFTGTGLTSIIIPDSVTTIGEWAFAYNELTSVILGDSVTTIASGAFEQNQLTSITIPKSIQYIGSEFLSYNPMHSVFLEDVSTLDLFLSSEGEGAILQGANSEPYNPSLTSNYYIGIYIPTIQASYAEETLMEMEVIQNESITLELDIETRYKQVTRWYEGELRFVDPDPNALTVPSDLSMNYQIEWYKDGALIEGQTGATLIDMMDEIGIFVYYAKVNGDQLEDLIVSVIEDSEDPEGPTVPVDPEDPTTPVDPEDPTTPVDPEDPTTPVDPEDPTAPVDPEDPTAPVDPEDPTTPVDPEDPTTPVDPEDPTTPVNPEDPTTPVDPKDPTEPQNPDGKTGAATIPKTSDTGNVILWMSAISLSLTGIVGIVLLRRKRQQPDIQKQDVIK